MLSGRDCWAFSVVWRQTVSPVIIRVPQYLNFWASRHKCICHAQHSWATWLDADRSVNRLARLQGDGWLVDIFQALAVTYILYTDKNSAFKFTSFDPPDFAVIAKVGNDFLEPQNILCVILKADRNISRKYSYDTLWWFIMSRVRSRVRWHRNNNS